MPGWEITGYLTTKMQVEQKGRKIEKEEKEKENNRPLLDGSSGRAQIRFHSFDQFITRRPFTRQETSLKPRSEYALLCEKRPETYHAKPPSQLLDCPVLRIFTSQLPVY